MMRIIELIIALFLLIWAAILVSADLLFHLGIIIITVVGIIYLFTLL